MRLATALFHVLVAALLAASVPSLPAKAGIAAEAAVADGPVVHASRGVPCSAQTCPGEVSVLHAVPPMPPRGGHVLVVFRPMTGAHPRGLVPAAEPDPPRLR